MVNTTTTATVVEVVNKTVNVTKKVLEPFIKFISDTGYVTV